eukprot:Lithocolla_globosa_v1_NODE_149_length_5681_cov_13.915926.p3 type:complete len:115 gc:universal NODE_149_length_5681_cov_13.915926:5100-4756(-)
MSKPEGLLSLNKRLSVLEPTSRIQKIFESNKKHDESKELDEINNQIIEKLKKDCDSKFNSKNFLKACEKTVEYIEEYAPRISIIIGYAFVGKFKYALAIDLLLDLFTDFDNVCY